MIRQPFKIEVPGEILVNWQDIVNTLATLAAVPTALIMRLDQPDIEIFVASNSAGNPYHPGEREKLENSGLYCERVLYTQEQLLVPDALADEHWRNNPDIKLQMISYLGLPILLPDGQPFGTICVLDNKANRYSEHIEKLLLNFRNLIQSHLELIYLNQALGDKNRRLTDYLMELQALRGMVCICANCKSIRDGEGAWRPITHYLIRHPEAEFSHSYCPDCAKKLYPDFLKK